MPQVVQNGKYKQEKETKKGKRKINSKGRYMNTTPKKNLTDQPFLSINI